MSTPRIVLDSNVVISGFLFGGLPARLLAIAVDGSVRCFTSMPILDEIRDVLQRPKFGLSPSQALALIEELHDLCYVVAPRERVRAIAADPDDNAILECAACAHADLIISGDSHLLDLGSWGGIPILSPADAIRRSAGSSLPAECRTVVPTVPKQLGQLFYTGYISICRSPK